MHRPAVVVVALMLAVGCAAQQAAPPSSTTPSGSTHELDQAPTPSMTRFDSLAGTRWSGTNELWLDPLGNTALTSDATLSIEEKTITYTWEYEGKPQTGALTFGDTIRWHDTFHMPQGTVCTPIAGAWGLWQVFLEWSMGGGPSWGWRIGLFEREGERLVMQMTVIKPSGEEGRAVRMTLTAQP
jgi:hypothetical protein